MGMKELVPIREPAKGGVIARTSRPTAMPQPKTLYAANPVAYASTSM